MEKNKRFFRRFTVIFVSLLTVLSLTACANGDGADDQYDDDYAYGEDAGTQAFVDDLEAAFLAEPAANRIINVGFEGGTCQAAIALAHALGFFEAEGLQTNLVLSGDMVNARDALVAEHVDVASGMLAGWLVAATQGIPLAFTMGLHTGCASAFVYVNSGITSFEVGQDIGVTGSIGGSFHNIGLRFIYAEGFQPDDFTWRDFPADQIVLALKNGDIQTAVFGDQVAQQFVDAGYIKPIRSLTDVDFYLENCCVLAMTQAFIAENPLTAERLTRAVFKAGRWLEENIREGLEILVDNGYLSAAVDLDVAEYLMSQWQWSLPAEQTATSLEVTILEYQSLGIIREDLDPDLIKSTIWIPKVADLDISNVVAPALAGHDAPRVATANITRLATIDGVSSATPAAPCCPYAAAAH